MQETLTRAKAKDLVRTEQILGVKVLNTAKEHLGKIYEIVLDKLTGQTIYVVMESGSFLGLGGKLFALPWNAIHYDPTEEAFILNVSKDMIENAPGFDKDNWPNMTDKTYGEKIFKFYGIKSYFD